MISSLSGWMFALDRKNTTEVYTVGLDWMYRWVPTGSLRV